MCPSGKRGCRKHFEKGRALHNNLGRTFCLLLGQSELRIASSNVSGADVLTLTPADSYIKEFVHGDFGRTKPNMCELLKTDTDILELDVEVTSDQSLQPER